MSSAFVLRWIVVCDLPLEPLQLTNVFIKNFIFMLWSTCRSLAVVRSVSGVIITVTELWVCSLLLCIGCGTIGRSRIKLYVKTDNQAP